MATNTQLDSKELKTLLLQYNRALSELDETPRLVNGANTLVEYGGKITKRPGIKQANFAIIANFTAERMWHLEAPNGNRYLFVSGINGTTGFYNIYYCQQSFVATAGSIAWTQITLSDVNFSSKCHECVSAKGKLYIKGFGGGGTNKYKSIVFDGNTTPASIHYWGTPGPTEPTHIAGVGGRISSADVTDIQTSIPLAGSVFSDGVFTVVAVTPATPFNIKIDQEELTVTAIVGPTSAPTSFTVTRGVNGSTATAHVGGANWYYFPFPASEHDNVINITHQYSYAWVTSTGHISNRSPIEIDRNKMPSETGSFRNKIPKFSIAAQPDTARYPKFRFFRTIDGGGAFWPLFPDVPNVGLPFAFDDRNQSPLPNINDPIKDRDLNFALPAPDLTTNSPPPTVESPLVVGVDNPQPHPRMAYYAGRIWIPLNNSLYFSSNEELRTGVPEESFLYGGGGFLQNRFVFEHLITNIYESATGLFVFCSDGSIHKVEGSTARSFTFRLVFKNVGFPKNQHAAITTGGNIIYFVSEDYRIIMLDDQDRMRTISDPLSDDLIKEITFDNTGIPTKKIQLTYHTQNGIEWLILCIHNNVTGESKQWVYDIKKSNSFNTAQFEPERSNTDIPDDVTDFWNTPWDINSLACISIKYSGNNDKRTILFALYGVSGLTDNTVFGYLDLDDIQPWDLNPSTLSLKRGYNTFFDTNFFTVPAGNHVNLLREPEMAPTLKGFMFDRKLFNGDTEPEVFGFKDDLYDRPIPLRINSTPRREESRLYRTVECQLWKNGRRFAIRVDKGSRREKFEVMNMSFKFSPEGSG